MITVSKDGPYLITGEIGLLGEKQLSEDHQRNIMLFVYVEHQITNPFVMVLIIK